MSEVAGLGIDVVEVDRLQRALARWGDRLLDRLFTRAELERARRPEARGPRLAARFAAKEAVMKALGVGRSAMPWREIEIQTTSLGRPVVALHGQARRTAERLGVREVLISLTHTDSLAIASAVAVGWPRI